MLRHPHPAPRVLVTSPQQYASRLCGRLINAGMRPIWTPGVATVPFAPGSADARALDAAVAPVLLTTAARPRAAHPPPQEPPAYDYVAFTSRAGVEAVMASIMRLQQQQQSAGVETASAAAATAAAAAAAAVSSSPPLSSSAAAAAGQVLRRSGALVCALGADGDLLREAYGVDCDVNPYEDASTMGLVRSLKRRMEEEEDERGSPRRGPPPAPPGRLGRSRSRRRRPRILCPVPKVSHGLVEPPVVPRFLAALEEIGEPVRVDAYATVPGLWAAAADARGGARSAVAAAGRAAAGDSAALARGDVDAVVFSSTAEAQGLALQFYWAERGGADDDGEEDKEEEEEVVRRQQRQRRRESEAAAACLRRLLRLAGERRAAEGLPPVLLAAHGPTTAAGVADVLGLPRSEMLVSKDWSSFAGVTEALAGALLLPHRPPR